MWTAGIFGLLGVIVGGLLNGFVSYTVEVRRERSATRAAARLLMAATQPAQSEVALALNAKRWWPLRYNGLAEVEAIWNAHCGVLASHQPLSLDDWSTLLRGVESVFAVYRIATEVVEEANVERAELELTAFWVGVLKKELGAIEQGSKVLERLAAEGQ